MTIIDPNGETIRIKNNLVDALTDLAHIVATKRGAIMVSTLQQAPWQYDLVPVVFHIQAMFTGDEIRYVTNPWMRLNGGSPSEFVYMGHELSHAYDNVRGLLPMTKGKPFNPDTDLTESNAVTFENYLRSVYNMSGLRKGYPLKKVGRVQFNPQTTRFQ